VQMKLASSAHMDVADVMQQQPTSIQPLMA